MKKEQQMKKRYRWTGVERATDKVIATDEEVATGQGQSVLSKIISLLVKKAIWTLTPVCTVCSSYRTRILSTRNLSWTRQPTKPSIQDYPTSQHPSPACHVMSNQHSAPTSTYRIYFKVKLFVSFRSVSRAHNITMSLFHDRYLRCRSDHDHDSLRIYT